MRLNLTLKKYIFFYYLIINFYNNKKIYVVIKYENYKWIILIT